MGLYFDARFTQLLRIGDIDGAIALLIKNTLISRMIRISKLGISSFTARGCNTFE